NAGTITLVKQSQTVPASVPYGDGELVPMRAGGEIGWTVQY
ncbi:TPA: dihydroorotase, partial [Neisseria meningitidis]